MNYKESHIFPSGLKIDLESEIAKQYVEETNYQRLENKYKYLFPELKGINERIDFKIFSELKNSEKMQKKFAEENAIDGRFAANPIDYLNLLLPKTLLRFILLADKYGVPIGTVIFQLWNHGNITENEEGYWILKS